MTRIVSKLGIAAALTLGMLSTAAAQATKKTTKKPSTTTATTTTKTAKPTTAVPVTKEIAGEVAIHDTVTVYRRDTVTLYRRDTLTVTGPTITRWDTVSVVTIPGWLDRGHGFYFGLGAGPYYPSGGLGGGQIPGYAFQANLGVDPAGSPLGVRLTAGVARPDESLDPSGVNLGGRPTVVNLTGDLKLRLPIFAGTRFPMFGLYGVGGGALAFSKDLRFETDPGKNVVLFPNNSTHTWQHGFGYDLGAGASLSLGHRREMFLEARVINFKKTGYEGNHQLPIILGVNWY